MIDGELGCSLRAAVMEANAKPGADLIRVPLGRYVLTRTETGALSETGDGVNDANLVQAIPQGDSPAIEHGLWRLDRESHYSSWDTLAGVTTAFRCILGMSVAAGLRCR